MPRKKISVFIPQQGGSIDLPPAKARLIKLLIDSGSSGLTSLQMGQRGILNPSQSVSFLKELGAVISVRYETIIDGSGIRRPHIARYRFHDWIFTDIEGASANE